ncbi:MULTISPECIES: hypothetical protein [Aeromonas]|uniref:hypothetical protein n=1 Tax=Aeromonas TaxID=642 RepID=UPI00084A5557|nr:MULTISPECIES: hypothetical protein [Aeromonas]MCJ8233602.1 hypothetical protein [Aeromonas veronii]OEC51659.1 hypothetical protein A9G04_18450 [Aeromonas sp. ANNP30]OEC63243.1 hypothetical protein A9G49_16630 [Aeromonas sp. ANP5]TNI80304.1 hypothetical protein CF116_10530 [Aeromonas veronii]
MQITSRPMPLPDYGKYPSSPAVTPEQVSQARNEALIKKDELQAQSEEKATARRTLAVSYTANQQDKAVVERYLEASGQESDSKSGPSTAELYQAANRYQRQQNLSDYMQFQQSPLAQQMGDMVGEDNRKGTQLDIIA